MNEVILDSSFVVAELDHKDFFHERALKVRERITQAELKPLLLDLVVNETLTVIAKRWERTPSRGTFDTILTTMSPLINPQNVFFVSSRFQEYWQPLLSLFSSSGGHLSIHDCFILLIMKEFDIKKIATFDDDFKSVQGIEVL